MSHRKHVTRVFSIIVLLTLLGLGGSQQLELGHAAASPWQGSAAQTDKVHPVILIHGLGSTADRWLNGGTIYYYLLDDDYDGNLVVRFAYPPGPDQEVTDGDVRWIAHRLMNEIDRISQESMARGGPGEVDVVVHSLGGLITRYLLSRETPDANGTVNRHQIRKFIDIATPHSGSRLMADYNQVVDNAADFVTDHPVANPLARVAINLLVKAMWEELDLPIPDPTSPAAQQVDANGNFIRELNQPGNSPSDVDYSMIYGDINLRLKWEIFGIPVVSKELISVGDGAIRRDDASTIPGLGSRKGPNPSNYHVYGYPAPIMLLIALDPLGPSISIPNLSESIEQVRLSSHSGLLQNPEVNQQILAILNEGFAPGKPIVGAIAVTPPQYDDIGAILTSMDFDWTPINDSDLSNYEYIQQFQTIFANCSENILAEPAREALRTFVENGGSFYASDYAYEYIAAAFPDKIFFPSSPKIGIQQQVAAEIVDPGLAESLRPDPSAPLPSWMDLTFDLDAWVVVDNVAPDIKVHLQGSVMTGGGQRDDMPLLVSFEEGEGQVVFTTFHNHSQVSEHEQKLLRYLVLKPITADLSRELEDRLVLDNYSVVKETVDTIAPEQSSPQYAYPVAGAKDIQIAVNWSGSTLGLSVYQPNGEVFKQVQSSTPPLAVEIPGAHPGEWRYQIHGLDVPYDNYPFVVVVGERPGTVRRDNSAAIFFIVVAAIVTSGAALVIGRSPRRAPYRPTGAGVRMVAGPLAGRFTGFRRGTLTIGRVPRCELTLPDHHVSRAHAQIRQEAGRFVLYDLNSVNGTFVNDQRVQRTPVRHGDRIRVGNTELVFQIALGRPPHPQAAARGAELIGQTGPGAGVRHPVGKAVTTLGRHAGSDVAIPHDPSASARHAEIRREGAGFVIYDLNSTNGTFVNRQRIRRHVLRPGDVIRLGRTELTFRT